MILMIKLVDRSGDTWNINLQDIATVQYADPQQPMARQRDTLTFRSGAQPLHSAPGAFLTAVNDLIAEYAMGPTKPSDFIFIGTQP
jgi:hypothetical protein